MSSKESHQQMIRSSVIIGGASVFNILIGLLRMKVVAVILGPAGVGLIGLLQSLIATGSTVAALGIGTVGTRQIASAAGNNNSSEALLAWRALLWLTIALAVAGGVFFWIARDAIALLFLDDISKGKMFGYLGVGVALMVLSGSQTALLTGLRRVGDVAKATVISALLATAFGIPLVLLLGTESIMFFVLLTPLFSFLVGAYYVAKVTPHASEPNRFCDLFPQWKTLVRLGFSFMVAGLFLVIAQLIVRTLVQNQLGPEALGYFQSAWLISMTYIGFVLKAMGTDYYPRLAALITDRVKVARLVNEQSEVALVLSGPVLLWVMAFAPWVVELLYSRDFYPAVTVLRWQILGDLLKIVSWSLGFILLAFGASRSFLLGELVASAAFVASTSLLLPLLGVVSTGVGFFLMYFVYLPFVLLLSFRCSGFTFQRRVIIEFLILLSATVSVFLVSFWSDSAAMIYGGVVAMVASMRSLIRLEAMIFSGRISSSLISRFLSVVRVFGRRS